MKNNLWFLFNFVFCGMAFYLTIRDYSNAEYGWAVLNALCVCWYVKNLFKMIRGV